MSKSNLIIGLTVSAAIHAAILVPVGIKAMIPAQEVTIAQGKGTITVSETAGQTERDTPAFRETVKASREPVVGKTRGGAAEALSDESLPPMRILWTGPEQLRFIARELGMRLVAINAAEQVIGEVKLRGERSLVPFRGQFADYSNRVRSIRPSFFGPGLARGTETPIAGIWVLVPASVDQQFLEVQKAAIQQEGIPVARIRSMDAKFVLDGSGSYALKIIRIKALNERRANHG